MSICPTLKKKQQKIFKGKFLNGNAIVITNGCPENRLECAEIEQLLVRNGWTVTTKVYQADLIILNLCGLLNTTEEDSIQGRPRKINIVLNWFEELKERVPVD